MHNSPAIARLGSQVFGCGKTRGVASTKVQQLDQLSVHSQVILCHSPRDIQDAFRATGAKNASLTNAYAFKRPRQQLLRISEQLRRAVLEPHATHHYR